MSSTILRLLPSSLRAQVLLLAASAALLLSASLAIPQGLLLAQKDAMLAEQSVNSQAEAWAQALRVLLPQFSDQARALRQLLFEAGEPNDQRLAELLKNDAHASIRLVRLDLMASDGALLASSEVGARRPLVDIALLRAQQRRQGQVFGLIRRDSHGQIEASPGAATQPLNLMTALPLPDGQWLLLAADLSPIAQAFDAQSPDEAAYGLSTIGRIGQPAQSLIRSHNSPLPENASDWPQHEGLSRLQRQDAEWEITAVDINDVGGYPVARWHRASPVTAKNRASTWLLALGLASSATLLGLLGLLLYAVLGRFLTPVEGATQRLNALARGDLYSEPLPAAHNHEVRQLAHAVEVFRTQALGLAQREFQAALEQTQHRQLIERQLQRLDASLSHIHPFVVVEESQGNERHLAIAFEQMTDRVIDHQRQLQNLLDERTRDLATVREALQEREQLQRLRQDMEVARALQLSHLPRPESLVAARHWIQVQASMRPAKEVGGDLYDFHLLDEHRLLLLVGDASGKGVPAAMFAMMARVLLRATATQNLGPGACLALVNDTLAQDNDAMLFCTVFMGILDLATGHLRYANAGHNPPLCIGHQGRPTRLDAVSGLVLGAMSEQVYDEAECQLQPGDNLVMYSDGITEAHSPEGVLFSEPRLQETIAQAAHVPHLLEAQILGAVETHMSGREPYDDITLLIARYREDGVAV